MLPVGETWFLQWALCPGFSEWRPIRLPGLGKWKWDQGFSGSRGNSIVLAGENQVLPQVTWGKLVLPPTICKPQISGLNTTGVHFSRMHAGMPHGLWAARAGEERARGSQGMCLRAGPYFLCILLTRIKWDGSYLTMWDREVEKCSLCLLRKRKCSEHVALLQHTREPTDEVPKEKRKWRSHATNSMPKMSSCCSSGVQAKPNSSCLWLWASNHKWLWGHRCLGVVEACWLRLEKMKLFIPPMEKVPFSAVMSLFFFKKIILSFCKGQVLLL